MKYLEYYLKVIRTIFFAYLLKEYSLFLFIRPPPPPSFFIKEKEGGNKCIILREGEINIIHIIYGLMKV